MHDPPPPGTTPVRSAMRQTPSPAKNSPPYRFPAYSPSVNSVPDIQVLHPTPPSPTSPVSAANQPSGWRANGGRSSPDNNDEDSTPGQQVFRSHSRSSLRNRSPPVFRSPSERFDDSGYFSPHPSTLAQSRAHTPAVKSQQQQQRTSETPSSRKQTSGRTTADLSQQPYSSSPQVNQSASQQQSSGTQIRTSWQAPRPPHTCSPVIPDFSLPSRSVSQNPINPSPALDPVRSPYAKHTPARSTHRSVNRDLPGINTSFDHPGGQLNARPSSSQTRPSNQTPYGPTRTALAPANGNWTGSGDVDVNSVVSDLLRVPPTSVAWQTPRGVLTWTPHPGLPDSGANLLGGGRGNGGRIGSSDWWTGGHPLPGACPTWTPGAWPPTSTSAPSRRALIQLAPWMIPNPCNASLPHIMWDISQLPTTAKRITGNHVIKDVTDKLDNIATYPAVARLVVACQVGVAQQLWGHVEVKASRPSGVTVWDVLNGIFEYFQKRVGRRELDRMKEMLGDEQLEVKMADAFYQRILVTPALPGYELKEGLKRVDCLGDACFFWGLYMSYNDDSTWQLNLGLVNRRRYA